MINKRRRPAVQQHCVALTCDADDLPLQQPITTRKCKAGSFTNKGRLEWKGLLVLLHEEQFVYTAER